MVKDEKRFPDAPGHWGYFSFGYEPLPYDKSATVVPLSKCACHSLSCVEIRLRHRPGASRVEGPGRLNCLIIGRPHPLAAIRHVPDDHAG
jgi:hypothetical protein